MSEPVSDLLVRLLLDQSERWRRGQPVPVETYLKRHPNLTDEDQILDLISNEIYLRTSRGESPALDEYRKRFPKLAAQVEVQFELHEAVGPASRSFAISGPGSPTPQAPSIPNVPGYQVLQEIGRGAMGVVYKARHLSLRRVVALKVVHLGGKSGPTLRARFRAEAEAVARLQHPNIVQIFEVGEHDNCSYLALELVEGGSLAAHLGKTPLPESEAARIAETLARAVHHAHQHGVVHRDLKPANILLSFSRERLASADPALVKRSPLNDVVPKITDFGLAKLAGGTTRLTRLGDVLGTPSYMAPEQARGAANVGVPADVWSLGAILYEMLTGRPPFREETALATLLLLDQEEPPPPSAVRPGVAPDLEVVCLRCLRKRPEERYPTAAALADDLAHYLEKRRAERPASIGGRAARWLQAALLVIVLLLTASVLFHGEALRRERDAARDAHAAAVIERDEFRSARADAEVQRDAARLAEKSATEKRDEVRQARVETERQEREARRRFDLARRGLYARQLSDALAVWREDPGKARALLRDPAFCPLDLREFTWSLLDRAADRPQRRLRGHTGPVIAVTVTTGGVAFAGADGTARLWSLDDGRPPIVLTGHTGRVNAVAFDGKNKVLATASADHTVRLWDSAGRPQRTLNGHRGPVFAVAFAPGGKVIASAGEEGEIRWWSPTTGTSQAVQLAHRGAIHTLVFSADGKVLASAGDDRAIKLWDAESHQPRGILVGHSRRIYSVAIAPDGRTLASAGEDGTVRLWDMGTGIGRIVLQAHAGRACAVAFSLDGGMLASAAEGFAGYGEEPAGEVKLWDPTSGQPLATFATPAGVFSLAFHSDGKRLVVATGTDVEIWPTERTLDQATFRPHDGPVLSVAFAPDGKTLATAGLDQTVKLTDIATGTTRHSLKGHTGPAAAVAFSPRGDTVVSGGADGTLRLWDAADGKERKSVEAHRGGVVCLAISADGDWLASGGQDHLVKLWDARDAKLRKSLPGHTDTVTCVAMSADGKTLASASADGTVRLWWPATGELLRTLTAAADGVQALALAPDGRTLATGGFDGVVRLWDMTTGRARAALPGHRGAVWAIAFAPDGKTLAAAAGPGDVSQLRPDGEVRLWDPVAGQLRAVLTGHARVVLTLAFAADGRTLATASLDQTVKVWDAGPPDASVLLATSPLPVRGLSLSADGRMLLTAAGGSARATSSAEAAITLWDTATGRAKENAVVRSGLLRTVAFSNDGKILASGGSAGDVQLWNGFSLRELPPPSCRHTGPVLGLAFGAGDKLLASGGWDGTVRLTEVNGGKERAILHGHVGPVLVVAVSPDGTLVASGGWDGTVRLWDAGAGKERTVLRGHAGPVFSLAFDPEGKMLASGAGSSDRLHQSRTGEVILWNVATGKSRSIVSAHPQAVIAVSFAADGATLLTASRRGDVTAWDAATGKEKATYARPSEPILMAALTRKDGPLLLATRGFLWNATAKDQRPLVDFRSGPAMVAAFSPDGRTVATAGSGPAPTSVPAGEVRVLDPITGELLATLRESAVEVRIAALSPDGTTAISGNADGSVRIWDPLTGQGRMTIKAHTGAIQAAAFAPDGHTVATGGKDGAIKLWDAATGKPLAALSGHKGPVTHIAWRDGVLVSVGDDGTARLWDTAGAKERAAVHVPSPVRTFSLAANGKLLATLGRDGTVLYWDSADGKTTGLRLATPDDTQVLALSTDGRTLATGSRDGKVRLWLVESGRELAMFTAHEGGVTALAFLPDERGLVSTGADRAVRLWGGVPK